MEKLERIRQLELSILKHKQLYYAGTPQISDFEFDQLEAELENLDPENKVLDLVGSILENSKKIKHDRKMLSLAKTYRVEELMKWANGEEILSTFKIDGVSCSLIYKNGSLDIGKTRGDGIFGEDITSKVIWIESIPKITSHLVTEDFEVRGEIFCKEENFLSLATEMERRSLPPPTSMRNIVAGLLGRKENIDLCSFLSFGAFDFLSAQRSFEVEAEKVKILKKIGFWLPPNKLNKKISDIENVIAEARQFSSEGDFQIDGLVFTLNKVTLQNSMGETSHHPRYKMAFKFAGEAKSSKIIEIIWSVSRNGVLTPVAEVEPVFLSGAEISRVTLHNLGLVKRFKLKSGDEITIIRSGEVIPKFLEVKSRSSKPFVVPESCPSCDGSLKEDGIWLICQNKDCPGRNLELINDFVKKIGIDDLSDKRLNEMIRLRLIKDPSDLFLLTKEELLSLDKFKEKMADKILKNIHDTKQVDLKKFLSSLGIAGAGLSKCEKIVEAGFDTIEKIKNIQVEDLILIDGFADKSAKDFYQSLHEKMELINKLIKNGVKIQNVKKSSDHLQGKSFCITGALSQKRSEIEDNIRDHGGRVVSSVSKETTFLVTNEQNSESSKYLKAKKLNIPIISEIELNGMIFHEKK